MEEAALSAQLMSSLLLRVDCCSCDFGICLAPKSDEVFDGYVLPRGTINEMEVICHLEPSHPLCVYSSKLDPADHRESRPST